MQPTKDTFYVALRDRLAAYDPQRTITLDGAVRPAIVVLENERAGVETTLTNTFCLHWGEARPVQAASGGLMAVDCTISYRTSGKSPYAEFDRGRELGAMDSDLLAISSPRKTAKYDYSGVATQVGSSIFWARPVLHPADKNEAGQYLARNASVTVFFFPEVNAS
jgi:hypothetical protein